PARTGGPSRSVRPSIVVGSQSTPFRNTTFLKLDDLKLQSSQVVRWNNAPSDRLNDSRRCDATRLGSRVPCAQVTRTRIEQIASEHTAGQHRSRPNVSPGE